MSANPPEPGQHRHVLESEAFDDPDLVDRIFELLIESHPEIAESAARTKAMVREEFARERVYIATKRLSELERERQQRALEILALFNGRNATEIARRLDIGRTTVWRVLKQAGKI